MVLCLREPSGGFSDVGCCSSFIAVFCDVGCCCFYVSRLLFHATGAPPRLLKPVQASTSSELQPGYFRLLYFSVTFLPRALRFLTEHFLPTGVFYLTFLCYVFATTWFYQGFPLGAGSSSLNFVGLHSDPRNTDPAHLFV